MKITTSLSASIEPDSRRLDSQGPRLLSFSNERLNWDWVVTGKSSSSAIFFSLRLISPTRNIWNPLLVSKQLGCLSATTICALRRVGRIRCRSKLVCEGQLRDTPIAPAVQVVERLGVWAKRTVTGEVRTTRQFHRRVRTLPPDTQANMPRLQFRRGT